MHSATTIFYWFIILTQKQTRYSCTIRNNRGTNDQVQANKHIPCPGPS